MFDLCIDYVTKYPFPGEEAVVGFEARLGISLPEDYKEFIRSYHAGYFGERSSFKLGHITKEQTKQYGSVRMSWMYGFTSHVGYNIVESHPSYDLGEPWNKNYLEIGADEGGNSVFIGLSRENYGHIFWIDHEYDYTDDPNEDEPRGEKDMVHLADSFTQWVSSFKE
ncbi:SMI1/KNR4 family protein [Endozoicomonas sp. ALE010]|uniref:SMI1/KNR4 family protein n=1 Tax=Endozoicomonas TaxID=305899 RepID=UPI003BB591C1